MSQQSDPRHHDDHPEPGPAMMELIAARFRALGEVNRLRIVNHLRGGECAVGVIAEALNIGQASVSKHLERLRSVGIVQRRRNAQTHYFSVRDQSVFDLCTVVCDAAQKAAEEDHLALQNSSIHA